MDQPEQSVLAGVDGHALEHAPQEQSHVGELGSESVRAARVATGQGRYLFGKRPTGTVLVPAYKSTRS